MNSLQKQTDKRFLLFERQPDQNFDGNPQLMHLLRSTHYFWSDRISLVECGHNNEFWNFMAFDLLMNEERSIRFPKSDRNFFNVYFIPVDGEFGFIVEGASHFLQTNLVKINWDTNEFELVEKIGGEYEYFFILVDKMNSSKFILRWDKNDNTMSYQLGELVKEKIKFGEIHHKTGKWFSVYSNGKLIESRIRLGIITVYDLSSRKDEIFVIDRLSKPEDMYLTGHGKWINDRFYATAQFRESSFNWKLLWTDLETKKWNLMNFESNMEIRELEFFGNNFIVSGIGENSRSFGIKVYSVPMRRPQSLRQTAWLLVVKIMKNKGKKDPYKAAKEFLPLNSDLRELWFKDVEHKTV